MSLASLARALFKPDLIKFDEKNAAGSVADALRLCAAKLDSGEIVLNDGTEDVIVFVSRSSDQETLTVAVK